MDLGKYGSVAELLVKIVSFKNIQLWQCLLFLIKHFDNSG